MAGPVSKDALEQALTREQRIRRLMEKRDSNEGLLDEEGIALKDLSHQRLHLDARPANQLPTSTSEAQGAAGNPPHALVLGRLYQSMGKLSVIPRYFIYFFPLAALIAVPIIIGSFMPQLELGVCLPPHLSYPPSPLVKSSERIWIGSPYSLDICVGRNRVGIPLGSENLGQTSSIHIQTINRRCLHRNRETRNNSCSPRSPKFISSMDLRLLRDVYSPRNAQSNATRPQ